MKNKGSQPLSLLSTHEYAAYQFYSQMNYNGKSSEKTLLYVINVVMNWLGVRIGKNIDGLNIPPLDSNLHIDDFYSFHYNEGFSFDITFLKNEGKWALKLKEPDKGVAGREPIVGRFFVTDVGISILNEKNICFGCKISVLDPEDAREVDYAFRPQFMRTFFGNDKIIFLAADSDVIKISNNTQLSDFLNYNGYLPGVIFTHGYYSPNFDEIVKPNNLMLDVMLTNFERKGLTKNEFKINNIKEKNSGSFMPHDADEFFSHCYGYGRIAVLSDDKDLLGKLEKAKNLALNDGDVVLAEPRIFGGNAKLKHCSDLHNENVKKVFLKNLQEEIRTYSKHKQINYENIVFEKELRKIEQKYIADMRIKEIKNSLDSSEEKIFKLDKLISEKEAEIIKLQNALKKAEEEKNNEYNRAEAEWHARLEEMKEKESIYKDRITNLIVRIDNLNIIIDKSGSVLPFDEIKFDGTYEDIPVWVNKYFSDTLYLSSRAKRSLKNATYENSELVYRCLYLLATTFYDYMTGQTTYDNFMIECHNVDSGLDESGTIADTAAGMEGETYYIDYAGSRRKLERHLRKGSNKDRRYCMRIYYFWDEDNKMVVIGDLPHHLDTRAT